MLKRILVGLFFLLSLSSISAQGWENAYGGSSIDIGNAVLTTPDGGLIACGYSTSFANPVEAVYVVRTDVEGDTLWTNSYGTDELREYGLSIIETSSGDFVIAGYINDPNGFEEEDAFLLKIDNQGNELWYETYGGEDKDFGFSVIETFDGGFAIIGETESFGNGSRDIYLIRTNENGDTLWTQTYGGVDRDNGYSIVETQDNGFAIAGYIASQGNSIKEAYLIKTDANGNEEWATNFGQSEYVAGASVILAPESGFMLITYLDYSAYLIKVDDSGTQDWAKEMSNLSILSGSSLTYTTDGGIAIAGFDDGDAKVIKTNENGDIQWSKTYGSVLDDDRAFAVCEIEDGGIAMAGYTRSFGNGLQDVYLIRTDSLGNVYTNFVEGNVFYDLDENCIADGVDYSLNNWLIEVVGEETYYGFSDLQGNYLIPVEAGDYILNIIPRNEYWASGCSNGIPLSFSGSYDTTTVDLPVNSVIECQLLEVDISTPFLRRCFDNVYTVNYCNDGTQTASNAVVEVTLDDYLTVNSSTPPWDSQNGLTYTFDVGDVEIGECGQIFINTTVECDSTILGQTHCAEARISPDSICLPPDPNWSGASIELDADCDGDTVTFIIKNVGTGVMSLPVNYIVIEDDVVLISEPPGDDTFLNVDESIAVKVPVAGATLRMEVDQEPGHPGYNYPSVTVEGCGLVDNSEFSLGYFTQYSENDGNSFVSIDCQENVGSYDPNDKHGYPKGYAEEHFITDSTELEYRIRFQNTGTDTAFRVVIRDTISEFLDISTFRAGASSHSYDVEVYSNGVVKFTFENILLPDSTTNELESHGFIKFRIAQKTNNAIGTEIYNSAAIYFDFNAPIITNETIHTVGEDYILATIDGPESDPTSNVQVTVFPNPFLNETTFKIEYKESRTLSGSIFSLYDLNGRLVREEKFDGNEFHFDRNGLQSGFYFYNIKSNKELIFGGKLIAH